MKPGTIVFLHPVANATACYAYLVREASEFCVVMHDGPTLSKMPDGAWENSSGVSYTLEVCDA